MSSEVEKLDWAQFLIDTYELSKKLAENSLGATAVFGRPEDSIIPAFVISKMNGLQYLDGPRAAMHVSGGGTALYVVGITSSGEDLVYYRRDCKLASLYLRPSYQTIIKPDLYVREVTGDIIFPWDYSKE